MTLSRALTKGLSPPYGTNEQVHTPRYQVSQLPAIGSRGGPISGEPVQELRSTYHDSFGGSGGFMGPSYKKGNSSSQQTQVLSPGPGSPQATAAEMARLHALEDRLINQERTSQNLLGKG